MYSQDYPLTLDLELLNRSDIQTQDLGVVHMLSNQLLQMRCSLAAHEIVAEVMAATASHTSGWVPTHRAIRSRCSASQDTIFYVGAASKAAFSFHSVGGSKIENAVRIVCDLSTPVDVQMSRLKDLRADTEREAEKIPGVIKALESLKKALSPINDLRRAAGVPIRLVLNRPLEFT